MCLVLINKNPLERSLNIHKSLVSLFRRIIIGTFQEKGAYTFWQIIRKTPVQDNPISCWKFCHTLHKVLREGYRKAFTDSYNYKQWILDTGKMYGFLEGYGKLIQAYCTLLVTKIDFHVRNPRFPGNLQVSDEELESIGENDVNVFFQLSCEMFDYLDEILSLQSTIFSSLDMSRSTSMTNHGQCKLAPLIPCIQDSSQLYDYIVKTLFRLHNVLPPGTLEGHRTRFLKQFKILKHFYINSSNLQYFRNLIQVPLLPDSPPNFLLASDIHSHVTPVVSLVASQRESPDGIEHVENLVDLSFPEEDELALVRSESNNDDFDFHFSSAMAANRNTEVKAIDNGNCQNNSLMVESLKQKITELELNTVELERKLVQITMESEASVKEKEELKAELSRANVGTDVLEEKERALEKFNKMKDFYNELREEHIVLLRKKAEVDKELIKIKSDYEKLEQETNNLERSIESDSKLKEELDSVTSKYGSVKEFNGKLLSEISTIKQEKDRAVSRLEDLEAHLSDYREEQKNKIDQFKRKFVLRLLNQLVEQIKRNLGQMLEDAELENNYSQPNLASSPEDFFKRLNDLSNLVSEFTNQFGRLSSALQSDEDDNELIEISERCTEIAVDFNNNLIMLFFICMHLQQSITNLNTSEELNLNFKSLVSTFAKSDFDLRSLNRLANELQRQIKTIVDMESKIMPHLSSVESKNLQKLLEQEVNEMDRAIQEAVSKIETMLETSKRHDKDIKLEVNGAILESSSSLMKAIMQLVSDSRELQKEIVNENRGSGNVKEFYQKNHRWTEGLITASKVVAFSAKQLVDSADQVVSGKIGLIEIVFVIRSLEKKTRQINFGFFLNFKQKMPNSRRSLWPVRRSPPLPPSLLQRLE